MAPAPSASSPARARGRPPTPARPSRPAPPGRPSSAGCFAELLSRCLASGPPARGGLSRTPPREAGAERLPPVPEVAGTATWLPPATESGRPLEPCLPPGSAPALAARPPAAELQQIADQILRRANLVELPAEVALQLEFQAPLLRQVAVELRLCRGRLRARLQASDRAGFDRLRSAIPELEEALSGRGLDSERVELQLCRR